MDTRRLLTETAKIVNVGASDLFFVLSTGRAQVYRTYGTRDVTKGERLASFEHEDPTEALAGVLRLLAQEQSDKQRAALEAAEQQLERVRQRGAVLDDYALMVSLVLGSKEPGA